MGERRFVIYDATDGAKFEPAVIPLSELKRRIDYIRSTASDWMEYDGLIGFLLHGEAKEQPDEWEAWVQRIPYGVPGDRYPGFEVMQQWVRELVKLIRKEQP